MPRKASKELKESKNKINNFDANKLENKARKMKACISRVDPLNSVGEKASSGRRMENANNQINTHFKCIVVRVLYILYECA